MQKMVSDFYFTSGIDTKTNPVFVKNNLLQLENGEVYNERVRKSKGYTILGSTDLSVETTNQYIFTYNDNLYRFQDDTLSFYRVTFDDFVDLGSVNTLVTQSFTGCSNISEIGYNPIVSALRDSYYTFIVFNEKTTYYELYVYNIEERLLEFSDLEFLQNDGGSNQGILLDIVGTDSGSVIYYIADYALSPGNISEKILNFYNFTYSQDLDIETDLYYFDSTVVDNYVKPYYPSLVAKYANGLVFVLYRTGTEIACSEKLIVRNLSEGTVSTTTPFGATVDLTSDQGYRNIGAYALDDTDANYVLLMFGLEFCLVNSDTYVVKKSFTYTSASGYSPGDEIYQTFNVGVLLDSSEFVMLKHNPILTSAKPSVCPFINKYNYETDTWSLYTNTCDSRFTDGPYSDVTGSIALAGPVVGLNSKAYFPVSIFSYLPGVYGTPIDELRCTTYLVDSDYNVVEALYSYDVALNHYYDSGSGSYLYSYPQTTPRLKLDALINTDTKVVYPIIVNQSYTDIDGSPSYTYTVHLSEVTSTKPANFFSVEFNKSVYYGNSRLVEVSGDVTSELNFFDYPQISVSEVGGTGSLTANGSYAYAAIYEWYNGSGEVVRSAQSITKSLTLSTSFTSVLINFTPVPFFSNKPYGKVKIYRTVNGGSTPFVGGTMYQVYEAYFEDITTLDDLSIIDTDSDTTIESNPEIYTSGGVLSSYPCPSSIAYVESASRVWAISRIDPTVLWFSLPETTNVALGFNDQFTIQLPAKGGDCTALANLDEKLVAFKKDYIYVILGTPPDSTDQNSTLRDPYLVNSPVGCEGPNSVVRTPDGIMFKSTKGIYMLSRSLNVSYIGAQVEEYNDYTVTSATLLLDQNKVKFTLQDGPILVYDYYYKQWSVESGISFVSSVIYNELYTGLKSDGTVLQESSETYRRDGNNYTFKVQTPWLGPNDGIQSYFCADLIQFLGTFEGNHILKVGVCYDYEDYPSEIVYFKPNDTLGVANSYGITTWGSQSVLAGNSSNLYVFRVTPKRSSCMAISLIFEDLFQNTVYETGNSFTLSHIRLVYTPVDNVYAINSDQIQG